MSQVVEVPGSRSRPASTEPSEGAGEQRRYVASRAGITTWLWGIGAMVLAVSGGILAFVANRAFYWRGDTQIAYFGALYHLGEELRSGRIPLMDPESWQGGAFIVEGAWGLFNPLSWASALGATTVSDAVLYLTVVKISLFAISASGTFLLTRSYGVRDPLAFVVAVLVPLCGFTMYSDQPSWYHGTIVSGLLPWVWWGARRTVLHDANPFPALVAGYLLATTGYIFGTAALAFVIGATILDAIVSHRRRGVAKGLLLGLCCGLPALATHLPFILSSSATVRNDWVIFNNGKGIARIPDLVTGVIPTAGYDRPIFYVAWLLPMLVFVDWRKARTGARDLTGILAMAAVVWIWVLGPSNTGPVRWPMRMMPYAVLVTLILAAVAFTRGRTAFSVPRFLAALAITGVSGYMSMAGDPTYWRMQLAVTLAVVVGLTGTWLLLRGVGPLGPRPVAAALLAGVWTVVLTGVQHHYVPNANAGDRGMPARVAAYKEPVKAAVGNTFMVGTPREYRRPGARQFPFLPIGNAWYLRGLDSQNVASATRYAAYNARYCMSFMGNTCPEALQKLLAPEPTTGLSRADLMSVSTLVLVKRDVPEADRQDPPPGWHEAADSRLAVTWVRDKPLPPAGGITWKQDGLRVTTVSQEHETVRLRMDRVPPGGGTFVMSRLDWPGYKITNAAHEAPIDDMLLTVRVPESSEGKEVTLSYAPPHWDVIRAGLVGAIGLGLAWSMLEVGLALLRRRSSAAQ